MIGKTKMILVTIVAAMMIVAVGTPLMGEIGPLDAEGIRGYWVESYDETAKGIEGEVSFKALASGGAVSYNPDGEGFEEQDDNYGQFSYDATRVDIGWEPDSPDTGENVYFISETHDGNYMWATRREADGPNLANPQSDLIPQYEEIAQPFDAEVGSEYIEINVESPAYTDFSVAENESIMGTYDLFDSYAVFMSEDGGVTWDYVDVTSSVDGDYEDPIIPDYQDPQHTDPSEVTTGLNNLTIDGLEPGEEYEFMVRANFDFGGLEGGYDGGIVDNLYTTNGSGPSSGPITTEEYEDPPTIEITTPSGGEEWHAGEQEMIQWNTEPGTGEITGVDLEYSADQGASWTEIDTGIEEDHYEWTIPNDPSPSGEALIRATVHDDEGMTGENVSEGFTLVGEVDHVVIIPEDDFEWSAGEEFLFDAEAYDEQGNLITDEPDHFVWENASNGVFYEEDTGEYNVIATFEETSSVTVTVTVVPADTDYIVVEPDGSTIEAGGSEIYTVEAYDRYHNEIGDVTGDVEWSDDIPEEGQDWDANEITVYEAGTWEITAEYENETEVTLTDTVEINVDPGDVFSVAIEPSEDQTVEAGEPLEFDAWAYDEYNNTITEDVGDFEWQNAEQSVFVEYEPGDYNVTATYEGTESPVTVVTVEAGDVDHILAEDTTATAGDDGEIVVTAYDEFGNEVEGETISVDDDDDLDGIDVGDTEVTDVDGMVIFTFNEIEAGEYVVEFSAEDETITDNATVTIEDYYIVAEDTTATAGEDGEIVVTAYDQDDNPMEGETISVIDDGELGGIDVEETEVTDIDGVATFSFNEETAGEYVVEFAAENEAVTDTATVTIDAGDVDYIEAEDVTETAGQDGEIVVTAYDEFGNEVEGETISVDDDGDLDGIDVEDTEVTDVDGVAIFTFNEETAGEYVVEFSAEDETITDNATVTIEAGEIDHIVAEDVTETAGEDGEIVVTAYDEFGNEVEDETISVIDDGELGGITIGDTEVTDVDGVATFSFNEETAGEYVVEFSAEDETITDTATVTIYAGEVDSIVAEDTTETAGEDGEIVVTAYDEFGNEVEGEEISVDDDGGLDGITIGDTEVTDVDGVAIFTFNEETAGEYVVEFSAENEIITDTATVTIETEDVDYIVAEDTTETAGEDGEIVVTAYDQNDNPIEGEEITVVDDGGLDGITIGDTEVTDVDGVAIFSFNEETAGEYVVEFAAENEAVTDTATVTIETEEVDYIVAEDVMFTADVGSGDVLVTAYDQYDNTVDDVTIEVVDVDGLTDITPESGETDGDGEVTFTVSETEAGTYEPEFGVEDSEITDTATVTIEAGEVDHIGIEPQQTTVITGDNVSYTATAYDEFGNEIGDVTEDTDWWIDADAGGNWDQETGTYTSENVGTWDVEGTYNYEGVDHSDQATLEVVEEEVAYIEIEPEETTISAGIALEYTATAYDDEDNEIADVTGSTEWSDDIPEEERDWDANEITVYDTGTWEITGTYTVNEEDLTDTATLHVEPGEVDDVTINPDGEITITTGDKEVFEVWAYDAYGNLISDSVAHFDWERATRGVFYQTTPGEYDVTATYEGESSEPTTVIVEPDEPYYLVIEPGKSTITAGGVETYTVTAYDENHYEIGVVTDDLAWSDNIPDAEWDENEITAYTAGEWIITVTYGDAEGEAELIVEPGEVHEVVINTDDDTTIEPGEKVVFSVEALDEYDNLITDTVTDFEWQNALRGVFYYMDAGEHEVTATYDGETSDPITITVVEDDSNQENGMEFSTASIEYGFEVKSVVPWRLEGK